MLPNLLLIPTEPEHALVKERAQILVDNKFAIVATCGFGPVLPAATVTEKIHQYRPRQVILCGIAGAYDGASLDVGAAYEFSQVKIDGIGVGQGFAVAAACRLQNVPLRVVRGISNIAGDRDHSQWKIADAMNSAMDIVERIVMEAAADE